MIGGGVRARGRRAGAWPLVAAVLPWVHLALPAAAEPGAPPAAAPAPAAAAPTSAPAASAHDILEAAFTNRYEVDLTSRIELVVRNRAGQERRRLVQAVSKVIGDRVHSIGRLLAPEYLRGMTVMTIESEARSHDAFLFLPSLGKVRRITTAQRGDAFFGTDITYEDLERRRAAEYEVESHEVAERGGEPAHVIGARPVRAFTYERVVFAVATRDGAILETHYYKRGSDEPYRVIRAPRAAMIEAGGHVLPTRLEVENRSGDTTTRVHIGDLVVDPPIDDHLFSVRTLESRRPLPGEGG